MSTKSSLKAGASRFAHLALGRGRRAEEDDRRDDDTDGKKSRKAEDDDPENGDTGDTDSGGMKKSKRAEDDDDKKDDDDEPKSKKSRRADDGTDDGDGEDDEDEPKSKKSKRAEDDDDCDDEDDEREMNGRSAAAAARRRERARCSAILGHSAAAANIPLAVSLACETTMGREAAIKVLKKEERRSSDRSAARPDRADRNPQIGADARGGAHAPAQAGWDAAFKKVSPKAASRERRS